MSDLVAEAEKPADETNSKTEIIAIDPPRNSDADALFVLGMRYSAGRGVEHDLVAAHKWFNLAAMMGHDGALEARAEMAHEMTVAQIAEAQRLARDWLWKRSDRAEAKETDKTVARPLYVRRKAQAMRSTRAFARLVIDPKEKAAV